MASEAATSQSGASLALGIIGAICWSVQLVPQILLNWRRHHTVGLQPSMMLLWSFAGVPLGIYNITSHKNVALQVQPQILTSLSLLTWSQCMYYGHKWSVARAATVVSILGAFAAAVEAAVVFGLKDRYGDDVPMPVLITLAAIAAAGLAAGVLRHYWDIVTHRSVRGISFLFVAIDAAGDIFSLASVAIIQPLDVEGSVIYALELVLWIGILSCGAAFNLRDWLRKRHRDGGEASSDGSSGSAIESASSVFQTSAISRLRASVRQRFSLRSMNAA